jgi:hypothetical protein
MSRTDVHIPFRVKKLHAEWRHHFVESHDHRHRPCNFDVANNEWKDCGLTEVWRGRNINCGCAMCTGQIYRKLARRADRYKAKRLIRAERWDDVNVKHRWRY